MEGQSQIDPASETACPYHDFSSAFDPLDLSDRVTLLTIYSKSDETDISIAEIRQLAMEAVR